MAGTALVLGAGGISGEAWLAGILAGFQDAGIESLDFDFVMGTSSGATTAAYITGGLPLDEFYQRLTKDAVALQAAGGAKVPDAAVGEVMAVLMAGIQGIKEPREIRRAVGQLAVAAKAMPEEEFCRKMATSLPVGTWPERHFASVAIDVATGDPRLFDRSSGVDMARAVAAACAIPMLCPPVRLADSRFLDAGLRSNENLDLATGFGSVLVISPRGLLAPQAFGGNMLTQEAEILRNAGVRVEVIEPQGPMLDLICEHMLDAMASMEIAEAGREQGRQEAARCASILADARR